MDAILKLIVDAVINGGPQALAGLGWLLFIVERYYLSEKRDKSHTERASAKEKQHRADLEIFRLDNKELNARMSETLSRFSTMLEVIKDRLGRG